MSEPAADDPFVAHRSLLFTVAYEMLGAAADAEDVVQEAWIKWSAVDRTAVRDPRAYCVRIVTRAALDRLRTLSRRREEYVGPWLPEPLLTSPDVAEDVALADSLSTAMLMVLETLEPTERAVFVLREVFDLPYDELAAAVDRTPAAVRQIAHRARRHVAQRRPRGVASPADAEAALRAFRRAVDTGDVQHLADVLAPDVVAFGDGGGVKQAMPRPVAGVEKVTRLFGAGIAAMAGRMTAEPTVVNGWPGLLLRLDGELDSVMTVRVEDGAVTAIYTVRNPEKLSRFGERVAVARVPRPD